MTDTFETQDKQILNKIDKLLTDTETLLNDDYWDILKERYVGLLQANLLILKKIKEELDWK